MNKRSIDLSFSPLAGVGARMGGYVPMVEHLDRRNAILGEAARLFAAQGISATTVREIADAVGILSGSLYHHFKSKDEMVDAILSSYLDDLTTTYESVMAAHTDPVATLTALVHGSLGVIEAHPHATEIYQTSASYLTKLDGYDHITAAARQVSTAWIDIIESGADSGAFRSDIPTQVIYRLLRDSMWLSVRWFKPTPEYPMKAFADDLVSMFLSGLSPR